MAVFIVLTIMIGLLLVGIATDVADLIKYCKCQKKWDAVKANRRRIDPDVSNAELCELYVDFCCEYDCNVEF